MVYSFIPRTENNLQEIGKNWILFYVVLYISAHQVFLVLGAHKSSSTSQLFVCVEVLRPSQPNGVMSSAVSLPANHTFTGQA